MKKFVSKISKLVSVFTIAFMFILLDCQTVNAEAQTIKIGQSTLLPGYVAGVKFSIKPLKSGGYVYCVNKNKKTAKNITANLKGNMNVGVAYIIENGYPNKSFTGDKKKDYYITQSAVWWYLDDTTGSSNLSNSFKTTGSDPYGLRPYIKKLVNAAKEAKKQGYLSPSLNVKVGSSKLSLSKDKKYYVSEKIDANAKNIDGKYTVSLTDAPSGTIVTDTAGNKQAKFNKNEKFLIKVPASKVPEGKTISVKAKITASLKVQKAYKYQPTNETMQPVAITAPIKKNVSDTIKLTATKPKTPRIPEQPAILVKKIDKASGEALAGAILVIKDAKGNVVKEFTSTTEGVQFTDLTVGATYTLEEKEAPAGYEKTDEKVTFTVPNKTVVEEIKIYNQKKVRTVIINKVDKETGKKLAGATLVIKNSLGNVVKRFESSTSGTEISDLANGTYTVEEEKAPAGYKKTDEKKTFTITDDSKNIEVTIYNIKEDKVVIINKVDKATGKNIKGAKLVIKDAMGNVIKRFESDTTGYVITGIANGTYTVEEEEAPAGYKKTDEKQTFTITDDSKAIEVTIYNVKEDKVVIINKVDKTTGKNIKGAKLVIKDAMGNVIKRFESDTTGYEITGIANGTYTVEEEEAPAGYKKTDEKKTFTVDETTTKISVTIENELVEGNASITKVDATTGKTLSGAEILVTNEKGEEVDRFISSNSSHILKDLAYGTYTVEEISAPEGYILSEEKQTFTIDENNLSAQITIKNTPKENEVEVPDTSSNSSLFTLLGIAIMSMGVGYVYKTNKQQS